MFKRDLTLLPITQNTSASQTKLGNEQWRAADSITHFEKRLPLKYIFGKRGYISLKHFKLRTSGLKSFSGL